MRFFQAILLTLLSFATADDVIYSSNQGHTFGTVLVSTIDGQLRALDTFNGRQKWALKEAPVLRAPKAIKQGFTFLPNPQDGTLYALKEGALKKMPFSIPQLVHLSPSKDNEGVLYAGNKKDVWFGLDPETGSKIETLSSMTAERICPANKARAIFIGRSEYHLSMFDTKDRTRTWNATFTDYSAHLLPTDAAYPFQHFASSSTGHVLTVDIDGQIVWEKDLGQPIVAMYLLQNDGLHKLRYTVIGRESMERLITPVFQNTNTIFRIRKQRIRLSKWLLSITDYWGDESSN
ncbi:unnamed protein product, partial [Mesorhabditis belari]|uniref:Uncharacterized protein n=1 Tax=Mesorhabditis belari TaxID=2138241 RepID=A0AAF3EZD3_9BILA